VLCFIENNSNDVGLEALESLGKFYVYLGLCIVGILCLLIVGIIRLIKRN